jgi:hypothetical protein
VEEVGRHDEWGVREASGRLGQKGQIADWADKEKI